MTKTIAKAAQKFPQSGGLVRVSQRGVLALMLGTVALPVTGVWAQTLSGAQTSTQSLTGSPLVVVADNTFSVVAAQNGLTLRGTNGTSFTSNGQITAGAIGIDAVNGVSGALTISTSGTVTGGTNGSGIWAFGYGTDLTISAATVSAGNKGILAYSRGTGAMEITATGAVTGTGGEGIFATNKFTGTDLTISAASVTGGATGIFAHNRAGTGALQITATGIVTGTNGTTGRGIVATNGSNGTDLTISAASVYGGAKGIDATNYGTGALQITATGIVTGTNGTTGRG
ncbi:hypothetical protein JZU57_00705, partial [bacterium]|nr:hypothetical protein [bacterium]